MSERFISVLRRYCASGLLLLLGGAPAWPAAPTYYDAEYRAELKPDAGLIAVELKLSGERLPSRITLRIDPQRYKEFTSTDPLQVDATQVIWRPRGKLSRLRYEFVVDHERSAKRYDSLMTRSWALFRGDKMVPRVSVSARRDLYSRASLQFVVPEGWSIVTPYAPLNQRHIEFDDPARRFDRPQGWMLAGKIGVRSERIAGVQATVAAPTGDSARRQDVLAFMQFTVPPLLEVFPSFPQRLLIVSAGDPMWRGGLSGPASLFLHADRPLISENRTSTLLHELIHVALGVRADQESDWIVEGLAEFYSIELLRRSHAISEHRYEQAFARLDKWAQRAPTLFATQSGGATTARAVLVFRSVDAEIRAVSGGQRSLDDVARKLAQERGEVDLTRLQQLAQQIAGRPLRSLQREQLTKPIAAPER
jgi:predicted metalloprotease with PDZ domain